VIVLAAAAGLAALLACTLLPRRAVLPKGLPHAAAFSPGKLWRVPHSVRPREGGLEDAGPEAFAFYLLLSTIIVMITVRLDLWLMGVYLPKSEIGLYNIASRTALPLMFVLTALGTALWPRASAVSTVREVQALLRKTLKVSVLVSLAGVAYSIAVPLLIPFLFGAAYEPSVLPAQIISLGYCIAIMANPMTMVGYSFGMARVYWLVNLLQMAVVLALLVLLLPRLGLLAAALTFVANNLVGGVVNGYLVMRKSRALESAAAVKGAP
jgi:O-antigen/teichoic acid export membrane protein